MLLLCREAGLVKVGVVAIDGTKVHANASHHSNVDYEQLAREILKEAGEIDAAEDELYGEDRGDELPEHLRTREGRRTALAEAKRKLEQERESGCAQGEAAGGAEVKIELDPDVIVARTQGREGWLREARHQLDEHRRREARPIVRSRAQRLLEAERRMVGDLEVERVARTRRMSITASTGEIRKAGDSVVRRLHMSHPISRRGRSTRPTWTRAT